jgi:hypothetical protein
VIALPDGRKLVVLRDAASLLIAISGLILCATAVVILLETALLVSPD